MSFVPPSGGHDCAGQNPAGGLPGSATEEDRDRRPCFFRSVAAQATRPAFFYVFG
jgi:hypothetical protein